MSRRVVVWLVVVLSVVVAAMAQDDVQVLTYAGSAGAKVASHARVAGMAHLLIGQGELQSELPFEVKLGAGLELDLLQVGAEGQRRSIRISDLSLRINDEVQARPDPEPIVYDIRPDGAVRSVQQDEAEEPDLLAAGGADPRIFVILSHCLHFSPDPVRVGDTWETEDKIALPWGKELDVRAKCRLDGRVGNILQISTVLDTPFSVDVAAFNTSATGTLHAEMKRAFDVERGMIVECKGPVAISATGTWGGPGGTPITVSSTFETEMKAAEETTEPGG